MDQTMNDQSIPVTQSEKLVDHPTMILESQLSGGKQQPTTDDILPATNIPDQTLYELDSNFSLMKVESSGKPGQLLSEEPSLIFDQNDDYKVHHQTVLSDITEEMSTNGSGGQIGASNLISLDDTVADPNNFIIASDDAHNVDLEFKLDSSMIIDNHLKLNSDVSVVNDDNAPKQQEDSPTQNLPTKASELSFNVQDNVTNICDEKFDLLDSTSNSENLSEALDLPMDHNNGGVIDDVKEIMETNDTTKIKTEEDLSTVQAESSNDLTAQELTPNLDDSIKKDLSSNLVVSGEDILDKKEVSTLNLDEDIADKLTDQFAGKSEIKHEEPEQMENFAITTTTTTTDGITSQNDEKPFSIGEFKLQQAEMIEIQPEVPEYAKSSFVEPIEYLCVEKLDQPPPMTSEEILSKGEEPEIMEPKTNEPEKDNTVLIEEDNVKDLLSTENAHVDGVDAANSISNKKESDDAEIVQDPQVLDDLPVNINATSAPTTTTQEQQLPTMTDDNCASTFLGKSNGGGNDDEPTTSDIPPPPPPSQSVSDYPHHNQRTLIEEKEEKLGVSEASSSSSTATTSSAPLLPSKEVIEEAIVEKTSLPTNSQDLFTTSDSDFLPTSASKILSEKVSSVPASSFPVFVADSKVEDDDNKEDQQPQQQQNQPTQQGPQTQLLSSITTLPSVGSTFLEKEEEKEKNPLSSSLLSSTSSTLESDQLPTQPEHKEPITTVIEEELVNKENQQQQDREETKMGKKNYNRQNSSADMNSSVNSEPDALNQFITTLFGQCASDILYWRDPKNSGAVFGVGLVILFSLTIFSVISVVAYTLFFSLLGTLSIRVYKNVMQAVNKTEEGHPFKEYLEKEITPNQERAHEVADQLLSHYNCCITKMRSVLLVEDYLESVKYLFLFWTLTYIGAWFNGMTLVILAYIGAFSLPKVYEMNKAQIDQYIGLAVSKIDEISQKIPFLKKAPAAKKDD